MIAEIDRVLEECSQPNWDGYNGSPVSIESAEHAKRFVAALPPDCKPSSVGADPDGSVTLEWYKSRECVLSASMDKDSTIYYAGRIGKPRYSGKVYFAKSAPFESTLELIGLIRRIQ